MSRTMLPTALVATLDFAPLYAFAEGKLSLKSVSVEPPPGDGMFPNGPGADAINNNCLACHSADQWPRRNDDRTFRSPAEQRSQRVTIVDPRDVVCRGARGDVGRSPLQGSRYAPSPHAAAAAPRVAASGVARTLSSCSRRERMIASGSRIAGRRCAARAIRAPSEALMETEV